MKTTIKTPLKNYTIKTEYPNRITWVETEGLIHYEYGKGIEELVEYDCLTNTEEELLMVLLELKKDANDTPEYLKFEKTLPNRLKKSLEILITTTKPKELVPMLLLKIFELEDRLDSIPLPKWEP